MDSLQKINQTVWLFLWNHIIKLMVYVQAKFKIGFLNLEKFYSNYS